jgi:hypothetical protein
MPTQKVTARHRSAKPRPSRGQLLSRNAKPPTDRQCNAPRQGRQEEEPKPGEKQKKSSIQLSQCFLCLQRPLLARLESNQDEKTADRGGGADKGRVGQQTKALRREGHADVAGMARASELQKPLTPKPPTPKPPTPKRRLKPIQKEQKVWRKNP